MSAPDRHLSSDIIPVGDLNPADIAQMFELYGAYYGGTTPALFEGDLSKKDVVFILSENGVIRGFSTLLRLTCAQGDRVADVLFSGDTIVDRDFWGRNDFALTWIRYAGQIKASAPDRSLYWFLTVKGHRTYRYLSVFSRRYYPSQAWETPPEIKALIDRLADRMYGAAYDPQSGIVHFSSSRGHLKERWADIPRKDQWRPEVEFFLQRNPGYVSGDEMVCLCLLSEDNLKPIALRAFRAGMAGVAMPVPA